MLGGLWRPSLARLLADMPLARCALPLQVCVPHDTREASRRPVRTHTLSQSLVAQHPVARLHEEGAHPHATHGRCLAARRRPAILAAARLSLSEYIIERALNDCSRAYSSFSVGQSVKYSPLLQPQTFAPRQRERSPQRVARLSRDAPPPSPAAARGALHSAAAAVGGPACRRAAQQRASRLRLNATQGVG